MAQANPPKPDTPPVVPTNESANSSNDLNTFVYGVWQRRQKLIIALIIALLIGVLIGQGLLMLAAHRQKQVEAAFQALGEEDTDWIIFTETYPQTPQAGLAFLKLAHRSYSKQSYPEAAEFYRQAARQLTAKPWRSRALLGEAMALTLADPSQGEEKLGHLTEDHSVLDSIRAEAAYNLAILYWDAGAYASMQTQINFIRQLEYAGAVWTEKVRALQQKIPQLQALETESADRKDEAGS